MLTDVRVSRAIIRTNKCVAAVVVKLPVKL